MELVALNLNSPFQSTDSQFAFKSSIVPSIYTFMNWLQDVDLLIRSDRILTIPGWVFIAIHT